MRAARPAGRLSVSRYCCRRCCCCSTQAVEMPGWRCPICRDLCNCSSHGCVRARKGYEFTGQLEAEAEQYGYQSVSTPPPRPPPAAQPRSAQRLRTDRPGWRGAGAGKHDRQRWCGSGPAAPLLAAGWRLLHHDSCVCTGLLRVVPPACARTACARAHFGGSFLARCACPA